MDVKTTVPELEPKLKPRSLVLIKIIWISIGLLISSLMYFECLHEEKCNTIATLFFAIIGLSCFINVGLPIDKILNQELLSK